MQVAVVECGRVILIAEPCGKPIDLSMGYTLYSITLSSTLWELEVWQGSFPLNSSFLLCYITHVGNSKIVLFKPHANFELRWTKFCQTSTSLFVTEMPVQVPPDWFKNLKKQHQATLFLKQAAKLLYERSVCKFK